MYVNTLRAISMGARPARTKINKHTRKHFIMYIHKIFLGMLLRMWFVHRHLQTCVKQLGSEHMLAAWHIAEPQRNFTSNRLAVSRAVSG